MKYLLQVFSSTDSIFKKKTIFPTRALYIKQDFGKIHIFDY